MSRTSQQSVALRIIAVLVGAFLALTLFPGAAGANPADDEATDLTLTNQSRANEGHPALALDPLASNVARAWASHMASTQTLQHNPNLVNDVNNQVTTQWTALGENVGVGSSITSLHNAFLASPPHHANMMANYNRIGIGAVRDKSQQLWIAVVFINGPAIPASLPPSAFKPFDSAPALAGQQYPDFLNRAPDSLGQSVWSELLIAGWIKPVDLIATFLNSPEFGGNAAPVTRLYFAYFLRIPDFNGLQFWIDQKQAGVSLASISQNFAGSKEFSDRYGKLTNSKFVTQVYENVLGRAPDSAGHDFWTAQLDQGKMTRGAVMIGFSESAEYVSKMKSEVDVTMVYTGMLRRSPDPAGFDFWVGYEDKGNPVQTLISGFFGSEEYAGRF